MAGMPATKQVSTFCPLCVSRCGAKATISDGMLVALQPDPSHPTGQALCVKGKAAPELVKHAERLLHPLKRSNPKGASDPGWQRITWDEALDTVATRLLALARDHGPESVVFSTASPSASAMADALDWVTRLRRAFGSPNQCVYMELCAWGRRLAPIYTYGASVPGAYLPDLDHAGCILYWGYNRRSRGSRTRRARSPRSPGALASSSLIHGALAWRAKPTTGFACAPESTLRWRSRSRM